MPVYAVGVPSGDPWRDGHLAALASLPMRFLARPGRAASVRVVAGASEHWVDHAREAIGDGARAVVVVQPCPVPLAHVQDLNVHAQDLDVIMAVGNPYLMQLVDTPVWPDVQRSAEEASLLISTLTEVSGAGSETSRCGLLAHLGILRHLVPRIEISDVARSSASHHVLTGNAGHAAVMLTDINTGRGQGLALDVVGRTTRWRVRCSAPDIALPAMIARFDAAGHWRNRPRYESGLRTVWRAVHEAMDGDPDPNLGLARLERDLALLERVRDVSAPTPR